MQTYEMVWPCSWLPTCLPSIPRGPRPPPSAVLGSVLGLGDPQNLPQPVFFYWNQPCSSSFSFLPTQVDKHIRRLDTDLARFEADLKEKQIESSDYDSSSSKGKKSEEGGGAVRGGVRTLREKPASSSAPREGHRVGGGAGGGGLNPSFCLPAFWLPPLLPRRPDSKGEESCPCSFQREKLRRRSPQGRPEEVKTCAHVSVSGSILPRDRLFPATSPQPQCPLPLCCLLCQQLSLPFWYLLDTEEKPQITSPTRTSSAGSEHLKL